MEDQGGICYYNLKNLKISMIQQSRIRQGEEEELGKKKTTK